MVCSTRTGSLTLLGDTVDPLATSVTLREDHLTRAPPRQRLPPRLAPQRARRPAPLREPPPLLRPPPLPALRLPALPLPALLLLPMLAHRHTADLTATAPTRESAALNGDTAEPLPISAMPTVPPSPCRTLNDQRWPPCWWIASPTTTAKLRHRHPGTDESDGLECLL